MPVAEPIQCLKGEITQHRFSENWQCGSTEDRSTELFRQQLDNPVKTWWTLGIITIDAMSGTYEEPGSRCNLKMISPNF